MADGTVIIPAYVDEAGARGLVRGLKPERDHEFGLICAVLFEPDGHAKAIHTGSFTSLTRLSPGTRLGVL